MNGCFKPLFKDLTIDDPRSTLTYANLMVMDDDLNFSILTVRILLRDWFGRCHLKFHFNA